MSQSATWSKFICKSGRALVLVPALALTVVTTSIAQEKPSSEAAETKDASSTATEAYAAGVNAFDKGKVDSAVVSLSAALRQGGLPAPQMAKALFYRGTAYRKQGKPAQAISDLTSAVWIKGGLSDADRLLALEQRKSAYKEAGLGTTVPTDLKPGGSVASTAPSQAVAITSPPSPPVTSDAAGAATSAWQTTAAVDAAPASATPQVTTPPPSSGFSVAPPPPTTLSALPRGGPSSSSSATPASSTSESGAGSTFSNITSSIGQSLSGVGSFFSNAFTSGSSSPSNDTANAANQTAAIATASTEPAQPQATAPAVTQGWGPATEPDASTTTPQTQTKTAKAKPTAGKFKLQVAALRSEASAQQVVAELKTTYASQLGTASPEIDTAAIGNMGTFYRVRVGPYADTEQPRNLCAQLKPAGYDCLIVTP